MMREGERATGTRLSSGVYDRVLGEGKTWTGRAFGDADKLRQVFVNVVMNALQVMPEGGRLTVANSATPGGGSVQVSVADTGPGISPEHIDRIFDPFFMTKEAGKGTGLGLCVSQGIIEQHNGEITVESPPGEGTTSAITIATPSGGKSARPRSRRNRSGEEKP